MDLVSGIFLIYNGYQNCPTTFVVEFSSQGKQLKHFQLLILIAQKILHLEHFCSHFRPQRRWKTGQNTKTPIFQLRQEFSRMFFNYAIL